MTGRTLAIVALLGTVAGCQSPGPLLSRHTTVGTLKTTVSQLEFQNEQLAKQVAELKSENRRFEDRLVQEEAENGELATKLDNALTVAGGRGSDSRTSSRTADDPLDDPSPPKVRRSNGSTKRRPPAASIPGRIEPSGDPDSNDLGLSTPVRRPRVIARKPRDERWLPVAVGLGAGQSTVK